MSGSLVEGFGNANSDIDLHIIHAGESPRVASAIGLRVGMYVDCEYVSEGSLGALAEQMTSIVGDRRSRSSLENVIRYYRLATGIPLVVSQSASRALEPFTASTACKVSADFARARFRDCLARAWLACALEHDRAARMLLREADSWLAAARLADDGEGYPSNKWNGEKAARRYGRGSVRFIEVMGYLNYSEPDVGKAIARRRELIADVSESPLVELSLAPAVTLLESAAGTVVTTPHRTVKTLSQEMSTLLVGLAGGDSWRAATDTRAGELGLIPEYYRIAIGADAAELRRVGILEVSGE
ncbi:hypothetical protein ABS642_07530 [Microbacterium sp. A8/3-1]|uniref:Polymerase nucleotidyl transferase domain-containing protein n=1 Tax=Microbacterium sp. A8/3-1 TaxID=3160749 RepID=A0AAU7W390_9MICO